jgi:spore coat protein CotH
MRPLRSFAAAVTVSLLGACSSAGGSSPSATGTAAAVASTAIGAGNVALYDDTVVHDIAVTFDPAAYDEMIKAYGSTQEKEWIEATVVIDGVTVEKVGMRLKGNSSLRGVATGNGAANPQALPWLIRFDKYVDGQTYQGHTDVVVRGNSSKTSLNEAVALELIGLAGEPTQQSFATGFRINGGPEVLRLAIELPNDDWDERSFSGDGVLYKAESTGDYSYRGDDPVAYEDVFDQETDTDDENLAPLIDFLDFINNSTDAAFAAELSQHLDVNAFARYLALQELVVNFDDIDGPGNNAYLRYDEATKKITVLSWDMNLAFGSSPGGMGGMGGGGPRVAGPGGQPPPPAGGQGPAGAMRGGPGGRTNILVQRFQANSTFAALVTSAKADLTARLYTSGKGVEIVDRLAGILTAHATDLVDAATIDQEAARIRTQVD